MSQRTYACVAEAVADYYLAGYHTEAGAVPGVRRTMVNPKTGGHVLIEQVDFLLVRATEY